MKGGYTILAKETNGSLTKVQRVLVAQFVSGLRQIRILSITIN